MITNHTDSNQTSTFITKIDMKASAMRRFGKGDDSDTLNGSDSMVTSQFDKMIFEDKNDNDLGTSYRRVINEKFGATIDI